MRCDLCIWLFFLVCGSLGAQNLCTADSVAPFMSSYSARVNNEYFIIHDLSPSRNLIQFPDTFKKVKWYKTNAFKITALPAILLGYGVSTIDGHGLFLSSDDVHEWREKNYPDFDTDIDDYMPSVPMVAVYALDLSGVESKNHWLHQTILFVLSNGLNGLITDQLQSITHIQRPDNTGYDAFPSAHTSSAFLAAEILHQEFKHKSLWISVAGYAFASSVGMLRILNDKHWLSDVVAGAGVGIFSVRITYLLYPLLVKKALKVKVNSPYDRE